MKADFEKLVSQSSVPVTKIGHVNEGGVEVNGQSWGTVDEWKMIYDNAIAALLKGDVNWGIGEMGFGTRNLGKSLTLVNLCVLAPLWQNKCKISNVKYSM